MKIEVLFPEFCNLFGDAYNMVYLEKTLPEAEFIRTKFSDDVRFTEEKMNRLHEPRLPSPACRLRARGRSCPYRAAGQ